MPSIQEELAALRSRKLTSKEAGKLKDAAPMSTPAAVEATLQEHKIHLKHVDAILPATAAPTGSVTVDMESSFYLQQTAKKQQDKKKKQEAAENLRSYVAPIGGAKQSLDVAKKAGSSSVSAVAAPELEPEAVAVSEPVDATLKSGVLNEDLTPVAVAKGDEDCGEIPNLDAIADIPDLEVLDFATPAETTQESKLNRSEKKSRKMMQKVGMRSVHGIVRATFKTNQKEGVFVIENPDVFISDSNTFVIFGKAKNLQDRAEKRDPAVPQYSDDVELVMQQAGCSRAKAVSVLKENNGDVVNTILALMN